MDIIDFHITRINAVAFSPDGMTLASASLRSNQYLWEIEPLGGVIDIFSVSPEDKVSVIWGELKSKRNIF